MSRALWTAWAMGAAIFAVTPSARAAQDPPADPSAQEGVQVLNQGPIHEAFAEPVLYEPKAGPVIAKAPPKAIEELPPDQKPEGDNVQWIPGYWAWDDGRSDYIWISGVWRALPPGRQWVPGYWNPTQGGVQWVPGYWSATDDAAVEYLPAPPASLENGASSPAPSPDSTWAPGSWVWQDGRYAWRPGFWVQPQENWVWTPAQYNWTPNGYVYNNGFWDYPLQTRGIPFAPVYFANQSVYSRPGFRYSPGIGLLTSGLLSSLFVRPSYGSYYFGNYYGANNFQNGIYPFYSFHQSQYGYDPLYAYAAARNSRVNPQWNQQLHDSYIYRRNHPEAQPPGTYAELRRIAAKPVAGAANTPGIAPELNQARPLNQIAAANATTGANQAMRFQKLDDAGRQGFAKRSAQVAQFRQERQNRELQASKGAKADMNAARKVDLPRSPIAQAQAAKGRVEAPDLPSQPKIDAAAQRRAANAKPIRHDPGPGYQPPRQQAPPRQGGDAKPANPGAPGQNPGAGNPGGGRPPANPGAGNPGGGRPPANPGAGNPGAGNPGGGRPGGGNPEAGNPGGGKPPGNPGGGNPGGVRPGGGNPGGGNPGGGKPPGNPGGGRPGGGNPGGGNAGGGKPGGGGKPK